MQLDRRGFLEQSLGLVCLAGITESLLAQGSAPTDLIPRMTWMNQPAAVSRAGNKLAVKSLAKTDFWRKTFYGYSPTTGTFCT